MSSATPLPPRALHSCAHPPLPRAAGATHSPGDRAGQLCWGVLPAAAQGTCLPHGNPSACPTGTPLPGVIPPCLAQSPDPNWHHSPPRASRDTHSKDRAHKALSMALTACQQPGFPVSSSPKGRRLAGGEPGKQGWSQANLTHWNCRQHP